MTLPLIAFALWLSPAVALLLLALRPRRPVVDDGLRVAIEVASLDFAYALPSWDEGVHAL
jgi:hypothetical protein